MSWKRAVGILCFCVAIMSMGEVFADTIVDSDLVIRNGGKLYFPDGSFQDKAQMVGPKGDKGDQGPKGDTGATGAQGPVGQVTLENICNAIKQGGMGQPSFCPNFMPVANAGNGQSVESGTLVTLDASASSDGNGDILTYRWSIASKPLGSNAVLSSSTAINPTFIADIVGTYVISLVVNDGKVNSNPVSINVVAMTPCSGSAGNEANFSYDWALDTRKVTITNNNRCDSIYIRATSYMTIPNGVIDVRVSLAPGQTIAADAVVPLSLTMKPSVIYDLPNGKTYAYRPIQTGQPVASVTELLLLDHSDTYDGIIPLFSDMFSIGDSEARYGDCANFSWIDRPKGKFRISPNISKISGECYVGNIQGVTVNGTSVYMPAVRYFVTKVLN